MKVEPHSSFKLSPFFYQERKTPPISRTDHVDAFAATLKRRGTEWIFEQHRDILTQISYSPTLKKRWAASQKNDVYAQAVDWDHVVMGITPLLECATVYLEVSSSFPVEK